jgi:hypothetical protein
MPSAAVATKNILSKGDRVVAALDMKGVPAGTPGKVILVQGLTWIRYWVWFDNGLRVGTLDRSKLMTLDEWARRGEAVTPAAVAEGAAEVSADKGAVTSEDVGGVPGHLIERSRLARERWAAKKG